MEKSHLLWPPPAECASLQEPAAAPAPPGSLRCTAQHVEARGFRTDLCTFMWGQHGEEKLGAGEYAPWPRKEQQTATALLD